MLLLLFVFVFSIKGQLDFKEIFQRDEFQNIKNETQLLQNRLNFEKAKKRFPCPKLNGTHPPPEDASRLRFTDIKVMMSLGDSITAGFAMVRTFLF